jgi:hypothetical protein
MGRACSIGKSEGKRLLGRSLCRQEENIKWILDIYKMGWYGLDSSGPG